MSDSHIVWLASYPKSGNTWFRIFLANLLADKDEPQDINKLEISTPIAASRSLFFNVAGWSSIPLKLGELRRLQPDLYQVLSQQQKQCCYLKTHEAYTQNAEGNWIHAPDVTRAAVYFVRNPLDVALSWANHCGNTVDKSIASMAKSQWLAGKQAVAKSQFAQQTLSWSQHVQTWTQQRLSPVLVLRYEDMLAHPLDTFRQAVNFLQLEFKDWQIERALRHSQFDELKKQELAQGFSEKPVKSKAFFRQGRSGGWRDVLTENQIADVVDAHRSAMKQYDYVT